MPDSSGALLSLPCMSGAQQRVNVADDVRCEFDYSPVRFGGVSAFFLGLGSERIIDQKKKTQLGVPGLVTARQLKTTTRTSATLSWVHHDHVTVAVAFSVAGFRQPRSRDERHSGLCANRGRPGCRQQDAGWDVGGTAGPGAGAHQRPRAVVRRMACGTPVRHRARPWLAPMVVPTQVIALVQQQMTGTGHGVPLAAAR